MESSEECYRTLCSLETLCSGRQGFFREFAERATIQAGDQWISKAFGRSADDEARVRTVFTDGKVKDAVLETLNRARSMYRAKDANASRARRLEGFEAAAAGQPDKALLLLSQAVLRAPSPGKCEKVDRGFSLPLALLGRAEIFIDSKEHALALEDLIMAEEVELPNKLKQDLARRKEECESFLRARENSLVPAKQLQLERKKSWGAADGKPLPGLSGGKNRRVTGASSLIRIEETATAGKRAVAAADIALGDTLVVEPPLAATLLPEFFGTHCQHCFSRLRGPVGCPECSSVAFCGRRCRDAAMASYHKYECKILALLIGSGMSVLSMLALRMVTQNGPKGCSEIRRALSRRTAEETDEKEKAATKTDDSDTNPGSRLSKSAKRRMRKKKLRDSRSQGRPKTEEEAGEEEHGVGDSVDLRAYDLVSHEKQRTAKDFFERSLMAAFLLKCLQRVEFFEKSTRDDESPNEEEIAVGGLLLRHLQLLQFNAHEVFETRLGAEHRFRASRPVYLGVAVYPTVSRFNHDCYPAVTRYFVGRWIVIRAIRNLRVGDAVAENYGPIFTKRRLEERQRSLSGRYWFRCRCNACLEDWPRFETLTNDTVKLRCPTEGCKRLHRKPLEAARPIQCGECRRKVDLRGRLEGVLECERMYGRGFAAMDDEQPEAALEWFREAAARFHRIAEAPHRDTHLAEIAAAACMADRGNTWRPTPLF